MTDAPQTVPKAWLNPHAWITPEVFGHYAAQKGISLHCKECNYRGLPFIDTGNSDGMVPRSTAYSFTPDGRVNMSDSVHMAVVRCICANCGNIRLFNIHSIEVWKASYQPAGDFFSGAQQNGG